MDGKQSRDYRILDLYRRFCEGHVIDKSEEALRFGVNERSVQRDIDDIRAFLGNQRDRGDTREIIFDRKRRGFVLSGGVSPLMTNGEILAVSKILLDSRAFAEEDMFRILDKLVAGCVPLANMKLVTDLLANEKYHYVELTNPYGVQEKLWDLGEDIRDRYLMELSYQKQDIAEPPARRVVEPVAILFYEHYFYLNAYIVEADDRGRFQHKYDFPAVFRVDRIVDYKLRKERFSLPYADRFQEGEFRKRVQFMYPGLLQTIRMRYTGKNVDAVLDRLPTAQIESRDTSGTIIRAEIFGNGIIMWLLSQREWVEVLSPASLRAEMKETLARMLALYDA